MFKSLFTSLTLLLVLLYACFSTPGQEATRGASKRPGSDATKKAVQQQPDDDVIRVETDLVNTLFTAVDRDRQFIRNLRAQDVRVLENDIIQPVSVFERETNRPLSLAILIDTSESQRGVLEDEKRAAQVFVDQVIRPGVDRAAIVSFTGEPTIEQPLTGDPQSLRRGIARVRRGLSEENRWRMENDLEPLPKEQDSTGYTGIWDAMWETIETQLANAPENSRKAIILLSDGDDTSSTIKRQNVIDYAVKNDAVVYAIGIRDPQFPEGKLDGGALKKISERTGGRAFFPSHPDELRRTFAQIDEELRSQYLIAYSPTNKSRDGSFRRVKLEVINPELQKQKVQLLYRQGYYARAK